MSTSYRVARAQHLRSLANSAASNTTHTAGDSTNASAKSTPLPSPGTALKPRRNNPYAVTVVSTEASPAFGASREDVSDYTYSGSRVRVSGNGLNTFHSEPSPNSYHHGTQSSYRPPTSQSRAESPSILPASAQPIQGHWGRSESACSFENMPHSDDDDSDMDDDDRRPTKSYELTPFEGLGSTNSRRVKFCSKSKRNEREPDSLSNSFCVDFQSPPGLCPNTDGAASGVVTSAPERNATSPTGLNSMTSAVAFTPAAPEQLLQPAQASAVASPPLAKRNQSNRTQHVPVSTRQLEQQLRTARRQVGSSEAEGIELALPAGFDLTVYSGDMSRHFNIPSEQVQVTRGSIKYVDHYHRYGQQTRFRFQLCQNYLFGKCTRLSECAYIHATELPAPTDVHLNPFAPRHLAADRHGHSEDVVPTLLDDPTVVDNYDTLEPGFVLTIYGPNATTNTTGSHRGEQSGPQRIPSEMILTTCGSETALAHMLSGADQGVKGAVGSRPRHCAHYQFKRLCNLGRNCHFIHSKVPFLTPGPTVPQPTSSSYVPPSYTTNSCCVSSPATVAVPLRHHVECDPSAIADYASDPQFLAGIQYAMAMYGQQGQAVPPYQQHHVYRNRQ
jgi:hypothetical protein